MTPSYSTNDPKGWCGDPRRGAALGRTTHAGSPDYAGRLHLRRVRLDRGGYDRNGTYFGVGEPLYWYASTDDAQSIDGVLRASSREDARAQLLAKYPKARIRP